MSIGFINGLLDYEGDELNKRKSHKLLKENSNKCRQCGFPLDDKGDCPVCTELVKQLNDSNRGENDIKTFTVINGKVDK